MLGIQEPNIAFPFLLGKALRQDKPIASLDCKRAAFIATEPAPHRVFPVRTMNDDVGNRMALWRRTPACLIGRETPKGTTQVRSMPPLLVVRLVEILQEQRDLWIKCLAHIHRHHGERVKKSDRSDTLSKICKCF